MSETAARVDVAGAKALAERAGIVLEGYALAPTLPPLLLSLEKRACRE